MELKEKGLKKVEENPRNQSSSITVESTNVKTYQLSPEIREDIKQSVVHLLRSDPALIKEIFNEAFEVKPEEINLRTINRDEAKKQVQEYVMANVGCKTSDIIMNLELDPVLVMEILKELKDQNFIQSKSIE